MSQAIFDIDSVGYDPNVLGGYFDFYVNNTFYLFAPAYYQSFYSIYLNRCLACYDGYVKGWHNSQAGLIPQRLLPSVARGLNNMLFAHGLDFNSQGNSYDFAVKWAKKTKFYKAIKKGHLFCEAGGTSLLKINRAGKDLYVTAHRIDTYFADYDPSGNIISVKVYYDCINNMNPKQDLNEQHYGICEERYFNENNEPYVRWAIYLGGGNLQTETQARTKEPTRMKWEQLPNPVKQQIKMHYPSIMVDKEIRLPFVRSLGCYTMKFTDDIAQIPNTPLGQPIGDILWTENFQYDQIKYFEKNEVDLARARALIPEQIWNKDDEFQDRTMSERFYQKVGSTDGDADKITPIQFALRGTDIRIQKENIYKDIALKLNISASSVASFLSEGEGAKTATEIVNERTKSDTWIDSQINLNKPEIDEMLEAIMRYYGQQPVEIIFKAENQAPELELAKTWSEIYAMGNCSPELFVKKVHKNLSLLEQKQEIEYLRAEKQKQEQTSLLDINRNQLNGV